jgi:hypothetical protein
MGNLSIVKGLDPEGIRPSNEAVIDNDVVAEENYSQLIIGPVTAPNVTVNGNLNVMTEINITGDLTIGENGQLNIIG